MPDLFVLSVAEINAHRIEVLQAARLTRQSLEELSDDPMEALHALKFEPKGYAPLGNRPSDLKEQPIGLFGESLSFGYRRQNLTQQLYMTFKVMAMLAAAEQILGWFPKCKGLDLLFGKKFGLEPKILSGSPVVEAEAFAAIFETSNAALRKSCERLSRSRAEHRFVFFYSPNERAGRREDLEERLHEKGVLAAGIELWSLKKQDIIEADAGRMLGAAARRILDS